MLIKTITSPCFFHILHPVLDDPFAKLLRTFALFGVCLLPLTGCDGSSSDENASDLESSERNGLIGTYYSGTTRDELGNIGFAGLTEVFTRTDSSIDFWDGSSDFRFEPIENQGDGYSVQWKGFINIDTAGNYGFGTISDDGSEVWVDGNLFVDNSEIQFYDWEDSISEGDLGDTFSPLMLDVGLHEIEVRFYEATVFDGIQLWWLVPGAGPSNIPYKGTNFHDIPPVFDEDTNWEIVPNSVLFTTDMGVMESE